MKFSKTLTVFVAAATLISTGAFSTASSVSADDVTSAKSAVADNQSTTNALVKKLQAAEANVMKINEQISNKTVAISGTQDKIDATQQTISSYQAQIEKAQAEVKSRKAVLKKQLISLQKQVGNSATGNVYVDFLLNAKSFSDLISRTFTVNKLNQASHDALTAVQQAQAKEVSLKKDQEAKKAELVATKTKLVADKAQLNTLKDQATKDASSLTKQINDNKAKLVSLQSNVNKATAAAAKALVAEATPAKTTASATTTSSSKSTATSSKSTTNNTSTAHLTQVAHHNSAVATSVGSSTVASANGSISSFIAIALAQEGKPYSWGAAGPSAFDCSGLVVYAAAHAGLSSSLPHQASSLAGMGTAVSLSNLKPGDLLFWGSPAYHVAIYIGGGQFVQASKPGSPVGTESISSWTPSYARRLF